jgi:lipopolysaccharide export LptBFGC system permease protein LptF
MTRFIHWRRMTWAMVAFAAGMSVWLLSSSGATVALVISLVGFVLLSVVWFGTRPLWRQGHGVRLRRLQTPSAP